MNTLARGRCRSTFLGVLGVTLVLSSATASAAEPAARPAMPSDTVVQTGQPAKASAANARPERSPAGDALAKTLVAEAGKLGKPEWRALLAYVGVLHGRSVHSAEPPFKFEWEEIGPGYGYGPAFGHWDIVHQIIDVLPTAPQHARRQLLNDIRLQQDNGYIPGSIWMPGAPGSKNGQPTWDRSAQSHPPVWVVAAEDYLQQVPDRALKQECLDRAVRQIAWFDSARAAKPAGYFYNDILLHKWESGVDEGIRFLETQQGPFACVDATSHVYLLVSLARKWSEELGKPSEDLRRRDDALRDFLRSLYVPETKFFYDIWAVEKPSLRTWAFEGIWPVVVGAATKEQALAVIDGPLSDPKVFATPHPIATVGATDPHFEPRMWRGPAWNSMTYWAARACVRYGRPEVARKLLEAALDETAKQFAATGTIWEFYDALGGDPRNVKRKPQTKRNLPWSDYLGHNPLFAMARMYDQLGRGAQ